MNKPLSEMTERRMKIFKIKTIFKTSYEPPIDHEFYDINFDDKEYDPKRLAKTFYTFISATEIVDNELHELIVIILKSMEAYKEETSEYASYDYDQVVKLALEILDWHKTKK